MVEMLSGLARKERAKLEVGWPASRMWFSKQLRGRKKKRERDRRRRGKRGLVSIIIPNIYFPFSEHFRAGHCAKHCAYPTRQILIILFYRWGN